MKWLCKGKALLKCQRGVSLVESLVAVAILGVSLIAIPPALSTGALAVSAIDQEAVAQSLAQSQLAHTKSYPYDPEAVSYPSVGTYDATHNPNPLTIPEGYSITVGVSSIPDTDDDIQKVTVTIFRDGESVLEIADFKANR